MTPQVRSKLTPEVERRIVSTLGAEPSAVVAKGGFESFVYEWARPDGVAFVKATWSGRRSRPQIEAEMAFVQHLADAGIRVAPPVDLTGERVRSVLVEGGAFHISATYAAPGQALTKQDLRAEHFEALGSVLARMHAVARDAVVQSLVPERPSWEEEHRALVPYAPDERVAERYQSLLATLEDLHSDPDVFGLIHTDAHANNLHFEGTSPTLFDFDDCLGFWYASDLAIVLYYTLVSPRGTPAITEEYRRNLAALRRGYEREGALSEEAWNTVPHFMNLRDAVLCLIVERSVPPALQTGSYGEGVARRRERVARGGPAHGIAF